MRGFAPWLASIFVICGCGPLPLDSAYADERAICGDQSELFAELVEDCRARWEADQSCAGVIGFEGVLEGVEVVVEADLVIASFDQFQTLAGPVLNDGLTLVGRAPYFEFSSSFGDIGGALDDPDAVPRTVIVGGIRDELDDEFMGATFRISTGAESRDFTSFDGELTTTLQTATEQVSTFRLAFDGDDEITGCFHAFVTDLKVETEDP